MFLRKFKYIEKEVIRHFIRDPEIFSAESDEGYINRLGYFSNKKSSKKKDMVYFLKSIFSLLYSTTIFVDAQGCFISII